MRPPVPAPHIVDVLIAERAPRLMRSAAWPLVRPALYGLLDYAKARRMADAIGPMGGRQALGHVSDLLDLTVETQNLNRLPAAGRCLVVCNHPTGIADGLAVHDALRTVRDDAGPITFRHALSRSLIGIVEIYFFFGLPAVIASVVNPRGKRLGDMAAGTYVVRERHRANLPPPVPMPPHLAGWVTSADLATMPDGLALAIRTFLPAAFTMDPTVREQLGRELLEEALPYVSPAPPSGNHPEYALAAIAADRRRRDLERLMRDARLRDRLIADDPLR